MESDNVMDNWKRIWEAKEANKEVLSSQDLKTVFMELKRIDGNDTLAGGVEYEAFKEQYESMKKNLSGERSKIESAFEAGCGSGPFLLLLESEGIKVGGMDYSESHIEAAQRVLKTPLELYCDEAINIDTSLKYECVFSNSMFEYFENTDYAANVLDKMCEKSLYSIGILDVHDVGKEEEWLTYRRSVIDNYDKKYEGLRKLFYSRQFFMNYAIMHNMDIKITTSKLSGYWNRDYVFDVYLYKNL